ncbi:MAG: hypothetical protein IFK94_05450 [Acidobacteria bacterium]|uniref:Uncharacterized protein n=1 Tax=Candidatus Polarisedimenticola svalbardensis TaxID=2886004 RepID=A0A8J6XWC6_9BACT|nr:hypothetical protein [Candidatus Polarisedimenticola svalbardensis]
MTDGSSRKYRVGNSLQDYCRPCGISRIHTILAASPDGVPIRVVCDYCSSLHNYRGDRQPRTPRTATGERPARQPPSSDPLPLVSERERSLPPMSMDNSPDLEMMLRRIIREESGLTAVVPEDKWRGGELVLRPGREGVQEKSWPIDSFFHKIVMVRNRLRTLEQHVNGSDLPDDTKVKLQSYITGCYGSLTSFNVLFADEDDRFTTK